MIKNMLFPIVLIIVVIVGGVSADFLRDRRSSDSTENSSSSTSKKKTSKDKTDAGHDAKKDKKKKKSKKKKKKDKYDEDKGEYDTSLNKITYMKFKRQFVVPVMNGGKIESLVLLNLNLELGAEAPGNAYTLEPKLRDSIMRELLTLSHGGAFSHDLTSAETYDKLQTSLLAASERVITEGVKSVLILDLSRQDQ